MLGHRRFNEQFAPRKSPADANCRANSHIPRQRNFVDAAAESEILRRKSASASPARGLPARELLIPHVSEGGIIFAGGAARHALSECVCVDHFLSPAAALDPPRARQ